MESFVLRRCLLIAALLFGAVFSVWQWQGRPRTRQTLPREPAAYRVDLNAAPAAEIAVLPAIGPHLAQAIVAARMQVRKPWRSLGDMDGVKGLGAATRAKIAPFVRFGEAGR